MKSMSAASSSRHAAILAVSGDEKALRRLCSICEGSTWKLQTVRTLVEAKEWLHRNPIPVVLCEDALPNGGWQALAGFAAGMSEPPNIVVLSRVADDHLWSEVLNHGAFDLLSLPVDRKNFFRTVSSAWREWNDRSKPHRALPPQALTCGG